MSRVGRSTASSTSRSGFVNPALVHASSGPTRLSARPARCGRGSPAAPRDDEQSRSDDENERDPRRGQRVVPRHLDSRARRVVRRPRREAGERPGEEPGDDPEHDAGDGEDGNRGPHRERGFDGVVDAGAPGLTEQHQPDDLHEAEHGERGGRGERSEGKRARQPLADAAVRRHGRAATGA